MIFGGRGPPSLLHLPLLCILDVLCIVVLATSILLLIFHEECNKPPEVLPLAGTDDCPQLKSVPLQYHSPYRNRMQQPEPPWNPVFSLEFLYGKAEPFFSVSSVGLFL